ncbi:MAG: hypothetical protein BWZ10_00230 [candidate division BRC1 bacterium ADurb.BinA364]|nr:MAG: hypothetical protein BWZ10_00230 [candidate division BRC1 bacterium ADurb.BinA364]
MWPPMPSFSRLARTTIAIAFQRTMLLMRRSISRLPGKRGCFASGIELMNGVLAEKGSATPSSCALSLSLPSKASTRSGPWRSRTSSSDSIHSSASVLKIALAFLRSGESAIPAPRGVWWPKKERGRPERAKVARGARSEGFFTLLARKPARAISRARPAAGCRRPRPAPADDWHWKRHSPKNRPNRA